MRMVLLIALFVVVVVIVLLATSLAAQEAAWTRPGHAACDDYPMWAAIHEARSAEGGAWARAARPAVLASECWVTTDSVLVLVEDRKKGALQVRTGKDAPLWWLAEEAVYP